MGGDSEMSSIPKGYKKTELGVIPEDWRVHELGDIVTIGSAKRVLRTDWKDQGIPFYRAREIAVLSDNGKVDNELFISYELYCAYDTLSPAPRPGDIMLSAVGTVGRVYCVKSHDRFYYKDASVLCIRKSDIINSEYLKFQFNFYVVKKQIEEGSEGSTVSTITIARANKYKIILPPLLEQKAIAEALSDMDALIEAQKELIAKKRDIKQGAMQDLLSGRVRLPGYETKGWKHTDIGDIPTDWEVSQIGKIADIISGGTPKTTEKSFWNGTILWCTPTDITRTSGRYIERTEKTITDDGLKNSSAILLPINSLLLCSRATVGDVRIAKHEITTNQGFKSLVCNSSAYYLFIYYLIPFLKPKMLEKSYGSTFLEISKSNLASIQIQLPSYIEQKTIAETLSDMDDEIETLEAELEKLNHMKRGMMQELLTGRIRLI